MDTEAAEELGMKPVNDQQAVLELLKREGQISDEEYQRLVGDRATSSTAADDRGEGDASESVAEGDGGRAEPLSLLPLRDDVTINHAGSVAVAAIGLIVISSLGMVSWLVTLGAILVMGATFFRGGQKIALVGGAALTVLTFLGFAASASDGPEPVGTIPVTSPSVAAEPDVPGSLRIHMDEVTEAWNTVADGPRISKGLTRYNETGEYDTFIYRFGEWGRLAGAFDPEDEAVYALVASGWLSQEATEQFYLHLCFMVAPYSQECVDAYLTEGLDDGVLADFTDSSHQAEWIVGNDTWRLEIEQNVLTIRVFGADAA